MIDTPNFRAAVRKLGPTDAARARMLGMSRRAAFEWRMGNIPRPLRQVLSNLELAKALAADAEQFAAAQQTTTTTSVGEEG